MAKYAIMRAEKRQREDLRDIEKENNREKEIPLPRSDIDWSKTKDNIFLVRSDGFPDAVKAILDGAGITARKNAVVSIDSLYTASPEYMETMTKAERLEYFRDCLDFAREHYGEVYNAVIHVDEKGANHLHIMSVPLIFEEGGTARLSARDLMGGRADYHARQDEFFETVGKKYGMERGEVREADAIVKHLDTLRYKEKIISEEIQRAEVEKAEILQETERAEAYKSRLEAEVGKLEAIREAVKPLPFSVSQLFERLRAAISVAAGNLFQKIERMEVIFILDLRAAFCKMIEVGKRLFAPETETGLRLKWDGITPIYEKRSGGAFVPEGIMDANGRFSEITDRADWEEAFPLYAWIDIKPGREQEKDVLARIEAIHDIAFDIPHHTDVPELEEITAPEIERPETLQVNRPEPDNDDDDEPEAYMEIEQRRQHQQPSASDDEEERDAFELGF